MSQSFFPTSLFTLLLAQLLQNRKMAVLTSILMALLLYFLNPQSSYAFLITLAAGIGGTLSVKRRETRMGLLRAGPRLAIIMAFFTPVYGNLFSNPHQAYSHPLVGSGRLTAF